MSDTEVVETKRRGRPAGSGGGDSKAKKRSHAVSPAKKDESNKSDSAVPAKRGRGRPKGSFKKNGATRKFSSGKGRGRPPKAKKAESTEEEDTEENEDENDDNETGSDA